MPIPESIPAPPPGDQSLDTQLKRLLTQSHSPQELRRIIASLIDIAAREGHAAAVKEATRQVEGAWVDND